MSKSRLEERGNALSSFCINKPNMQILEIAMRLMFLALAALTLAAGAVRAESIKGVASVIDGDTIEIHGTRIRMAGIDAPESRQECQRADGSSWRCGQKAALALSDHIGRSLLACEPSTKDRYGRIVAMCFLGAEDINRWMVAQGWAVAYRQYSRTYVEDEERAHTARLGIWSGRFVMPADWRASNR